MGDSGSMQHKNGRGHLEHLALSAFRQSVARHREKKLRHTNGSEQASLGQPAQACLAIEAHEFTRSKEHGARNAAARAAFFVLCGMDLSEAHKLTVKEKAAIVMRLGRLLERERLKGISRHWSYDLNRHIALKQARDSLLEGCAPLNRADRRTFSGR
jgi:hypothetical protein